MEKVQKAADNYYEEGAHYGMADLIYAGILLVLLNPKVLFDCHLWKAIAEFLKMVTKKTDAGLVEGKGHHMFCSQFVYQCYINAGYILKINNPVIPFLAVANASTEDGGTILESVMSQFELGQLKQEDLQLFDAHLLRHPAGAQ